MRIIGSTLVHNDASKGWLQEWLDTNLQYADEWVILDDCSTDETFNIITNYKSECKIYLYKTEKSLFLENENKLRELLWNYTRKIAKENDWILCLDSDEIVCPEFSNISEILKKGKNLIEFKKIELWNKQEYNVDALWSNYFVRMFPFKDVPWGKEGSGFHIGSIPNEVHTTTPFYCSNIRIKHLGYMTEDFRDQKCEFIFKYNNKGGINKNHIEAIEKKPILKKYTEKYILPKTLLIIECGSLYNLPKTTIDFLLSQKDLRDKLEIIFLVTDCNINLINQIKTMEEQENNISYFIFNFQKETFFNTIKNKNQLLRLFILNNLKTNFEDKDYLMIASGETELSYDRMYHNLLVEKDVILDCSDTKIITLSNKIVPMLYNTNIDLSDNNIIDFFINQKIRVWGSGLYMEPIEFSIK